MIAHRDKDENRWTIEHHARSESDIFKEYYVDGVGAGKQRLGKITNYCEPRGNGYRWEDLGGRESECYPSKKRCLLAFIAEMEQRCTKSDAHDSDPTGEWDLLCGDLDF